MTIAMILLFLLSLFVAGFLVSRFLLPRGEDHPAEYWLAISFALGVIVHGMVHLACLAIVGRIIFAVYPVVIGALLVANIAANRFCVPLERYGGFDMAKIDRPSRFFVPFCFGVLLLVYFFSTFYYNAFSYPMASYDGRAIWNYKAKILFHERTTDTPAFLDPERVHYHRDYPLLVPLAEFGVYASIGHVDEDNVRLFFSTLFLCFTLFIYSCVARESSRGFALLVALIFAGMPFRELWVVRDGGAINSCEADVPLSFFACLAVVHFRRWWRDDSVHAVLLGGVFAGAAYMTKKEGIVVVAVLLAACGLQWLLASGRNRFDDVKKLALGFAVVPIVALPWLVVKTSLPNLYDEDYVAMFTTEVIQHIPKRIEIIFDLWLGDVGNISQWSYVWPLYFIVLVASLPDLLRRRVLFVHAVILVWLLAYFVVYSFSPLNLVFHMMTSIRRLMAHIFPIVVLQVAFFLAERGKTLCEAMTAACGMGLKPATAGAAGEKE